MAATANKRRAGGAKAGLHRYAPFAGALSVSTAALLANPAFALDWKVTPSVGATATYTDNANQSASNPEDALVLTVTPAVSLQSQGSRRVQASLGYGLTGVARFGEDNSTDVNHSLGAIGKAELVEDFLFVDASARVSQELISLFGSPADANINDSNRATVGTYSISPYIQKRLGSFAQAQARYTTGGALFEDDVASDSSVNSFSAALTSGTRFTDLSWGLNYSLRKADNRDAADATFERANASVGYALTRKFRVFGTVGQEWNEYVGATGTRSEFDGSSYSVGFGWAPTRRTSVEASVGERYFGNTYSFSGSYRTRASRWTARYSEDVSDITQQFLEETGRIFWACDAGTQILVRETLDFTNPDPTSCVGPISSGQLAAELSRRGFSIKDLIAANLLDIGIAGGVYIIKSLHVGVSWDVGRLGFALSAQDTRRLYQALDNAEDRVQGASASVSYRLSPQTTASSGLSFTRNSADAALHRGVARDDDIIGLSLALNHRFTADLSGALSYYHTQRDSNVPDSDYEENRLMASVHMRF